MNKIIDNNMIKDTIIKIIKNNIINKIKKRPIRLCNGHKKIESKHNKMLTKDRMNKISK